MIGTLLFITEGGAGTGYGHLLRCSHIAREMASRGAAICLATGPDLERAAACFPETTRILPFDVRRPRAEALPEAELALVDTFALGAAFERALRQKVRSLAVIDGLLRSHDADLLIDPVARDASERLNRGQTVGHILEGPDFIPLDPRFATLPRRRGPDGMRLGVVLGGDADGADLSALVDALGTVGFDGQIDLTAPTPLRSVPTLDIQQQPWCSDMPALVASCDAMIGNCGMSAWERCAAGCPSLAFQVAPNQKHVANVLERSGAARVVRRRPSELQAGELAAEIGTFLGDGESLLRYGTNARALCDGRGVQRIADVLGKLMRARV